MASDFGGTRNGMVVHWPKGIKAKGEVRTQFHHVIDIAPTILEAAGLPEPKSVDGTVQTPIEGVSLKYTFDDAAAKTKHTTQYFEIFGNRSIYHDGWLAGTVHRPAWDFLPKTTLEKDTWELYDTRTDFSLANNLAEKNPAKLKELQDSVPEGSGEVPGSAAGRSRAGTHECRTRRPARSDGRPHVAHALPRHEGDDARTCLSTSRTSRTRSRPTWRFPKGARTA